ncbi:gliding motility protein GldB-related protein [Jiulongibacter sp. NS-SX5]|uniref:gliding motility protein GldB-related protein n=1 Tax=Jiulongibacter sp. NS-SX5 TaxID=3463854 RepID=UPI004058557D
MTKSLKLIFTLSLLITLIWGCEENTKTINSTDPLDINLVRFDQQLMSLESKEDLQDFLEKNPWYSKSLYRAFPEDTSFISHLFEIISHPGSRAFYQETDSIFGNYESLRQEFGKAFANIKQTYPDFKVPSVYITFTGLENDLFVGDSIVIISSEAFAGPSASYRPDQPEYIQLRYQPEYIVPTVVRLMAGPYIENNPGGELLNDMIFFGKSFEFTKAMLPETPESQIIAIPDSSLEGNWYNQDIIWAHFIDKQLLYEQNRRVKEKYIGERPKVPEIGPSCPGRVGQWLGWRIIDKFRTENPKVSLEELLKIKDPQEILRKSKYRGLVEE